MVGGLNLIDLTKDRSVTATSLWVEAAATLDATDLLVAYDDLKGRAPMRGRRQKPHFVGHTGVPSTGAATNRNEEHLAIALVNDQPRWRLGDTGHLDLVDYQVPLKARRDDKGIGKVDLFAVSSDDAPVVIELKVVRPGGSADTPLHAFIEALGYSAIVERNHRTINSELSGMYRRRLIAERPWVVVAAPDDYWAAWDGRPMTSTWRHAMGDLCGRLAVELQTPILFVGLGTPSVELGLNHRPPHLLSEAKPHIMESWDPA